MHYSRAAPGIASNVAEMSPPVDDSATPSVSLRALSRSATRSAIGSSVCIYCFCASNALISRPFAASVNPSNRPASARRFAAFAKQMDATLTKQIAESKAPRVEPASGTGPAPGTSPAQQPAKPAREGEEPVAERRPGG